MKILHIMPDGAAGGGATVVLGLIEGLQREGWHSHFMGEAGSYCCGAAAALGAEVHEAPMMYSRTAPAIAQAVHAVADGVKPDIIHLHGGRAAFFARELKHPRVAYTVHGYHFARKDWLRRTAGAFAEKMAVAFRRQIVFVCDYDRSVGRAFRVIHPDCKTRVIYNGVSFADLPAPNPQPKTIAYISRLVEQKDPLMAVQVMSLLAGEGFRMTIAGGGGLMDSVRQAITQKGLEQVIDVRGEVSRPEALSILAGCEAMLMTSRWEGLPLAPLEAMACGVPVVASGVCGIPEIIESGRDGFLATGHEAALYAEPLRRLSADSALRMEIIGAAKEKVAAKFSWDQCLAGYRALYEEMLAS